MITPVLNCERVLELVPKVVDGEGLEWEVQAVADHTASCADCAQLRADLVEIGTLVRTPLRAAVAQADFSQMWRAVERGMDRVDAERRRERSVVAPSFGWVAFSRFASVAAVAGIAAVAVFQPFAERQLTDNRVEISSIEGGADNTVMIFESPEEQVTFIWVIDEAPAEEKAPI